MISKLVQKVKTRFVNTTLKRKILLLTVLLVTLSQVLLASSLAMTYYRVGVTQLFNKDVKQALDSSVELCDWYIDEHRSNMYSDILALRQIIKNNEKRLWQNPNEFQIVLDEEAKRRKLDEIIIFDKDKIIAKNKLAITFPLLEIANMKLERISSYNEIVPLDSLDLDSKIRMLASYDFNRSLFILVGKRFDNNIVQHILNTQSKYQELVQSINTTQATLKIMFLATSSLLIIFSFLASVRLAKFISQPIHSLVNATELIKQGNYSVTVPEKPGRDETAILARAFNEMTSTLKYQRANLIKAHDEIDNRRKFIEFILSEIASGVIILSPKGRLVLSNMAAMKMLNIDTVYMRRDINHCFPELRIIFSAKSYDAEELCRTKTLDIIRNNKHINLEIKIREVKKANGKCDYFVVTLNDISELVSAQRTSAWADVARRIAHEIKNPLTPITLSVELLKNKYINQIHSGKENFERYISTISTHLDTIARIVEEFVNFARIPKPNMGKCDINSLIMDVLLSAQSVYKNIEYCFDNRAQSHYASCDYIQIAQVLTNLLKNAAESIEVRISNGMPENYTPKIEVCLHEDKGSFFTIAIKDNGIGISQKLNDRLFEPYVTTKVKGTGLGLAIVKKIIEDHDGELSVLGLEDNKGAVASFTIPKFNLGE